VFCWYFSRPTRTVIAYILEFFGASPSMPTLTACAVKMIKGQLARTSLRKAHLVRFAFSFTLKILKRVPGQIVRYKKNHSVTGPIRLTPGKSKLSANKSPGIRGRMLAAVLSTLACILGPNVNEKPPPSPALPFFLTLMNSGAKNSEPCRPALATKHHLPPHLLNSLRFSPSPI